MNQYFNLSKSDNQKEIHLVDDPEYGSYEREENSKSDDLLVTAFKKVWEKKSQSIRDTIEENIDSGKSYKYFAIFLAIGCVFLLLSLFFLPTVVLSPHKFAMLFSIGSMCILASMAFYRGPVTYTKRLFRKDQALISIMYIISLFLTLYASMIAGSFLLTMISCGIQLFSLLWFVTGSFPGGTTGIKACASAIREKILGR
ncbi:unnamed protein product [Moneuplotes crassus]|uniref:Vesicle transport protein n=1 Tax=Euplotes crassus TaxID=5936 RepID=A0AAD2D592_EUPCR|nr:unnamed protein product [Moneuplotes crassus]